VEKYCRVRQATDNTMTCIACWISKVINIHLENVMLIAFPLQQTLHKHAKYYVIHTLPVLLYFQEPYDLPGRYCSFVIKIILVSHIFFVSPLQILNQFTYFYETWCKYYIFGNHQAVIHLTSYSL